MGQTKNLKCKECGNEWTHYSGVGMLGKAIKGSKRDNTTVDVECCSIQTYLTPIGNDCAACLRCSDYFPNVVR